MTNANNFLFVTWEGGGNVPPVLGVAERLIKRGHRVTVLGEPCLKAHILQIGAQYQGFKAHFTREDRSIDLIQDWKAKPLTVPSIDNILIGPALSVANETTALLLQNDFDAVIADFMMPGALIAAEAMTVKRVALFHMPEYFPGPGRPPGGLGLLPNHGVMGKLRDKLLEKVFFKVLKKYIAPLNRVRSQFGLAPHENMVETYHQADLRLIQTCRDFDAPIEPAPENVRYVGPILDDPNWSSSPSMDISKLLSGLNNKQAPLILVSLSSTFQNQKALLQRIIDAFKGVNCNAIFTLGPAMENECFTSTDNVLLLGSAPHNKILPLVDGVITHAGHGTVMRALSFGKPLICLPMGRDQLDNAALISHHGAGIKLKQSSSARTITKALLSIIEDASFKTNATTLQHAIIRDSQQDLAVNEIEALVASTSKTSKTEYAPSIA